jgi:hypothetical protein
MYAAILNAKATRPSEISIKLAAVVHKMNQDKSDEIEEHLTGAEFRRLTAELAAATQPLYPEYSAAVKAAIDRGYLTMHASGGYLSFTQAGADLFA